MIYCKHLARSTPEYRKWHPGWDHWCSIYIINSLLAANCMCSWAPHLFDCKPRLIKFSHHFMWLTFFFIKNYIWCSVFP